MRYEDWPYHPSRLPEDKYEKEKALEALQARFYEELEENPKVAEFLKPYREGSGEYFLKQYAFRKRLYIAHADYRLSKAARRELRYRDESEAAYMAILQKKLYNIYLLWCAEQITLPGIDITWDFYTLSRYPHTCSFIEPATEEEIRTMQAFLATDNCDLGRWGNALAVHSIVQLVRNEEDEEDEGFDADDAMPEWFRFYDTYLGTGHLLLLPDIRGQKEERYLDLRHEKKRAEREESNAPAYIVDDRPWLPYYDGKLHYELSRLLDDEIFQELFYDEWQSAAAERTAEDEAGVYDIDDIVMALEEVPNPPRVRGGVTWREALYYCWQDHLKAAVSSDLPLVWEEHKFYHETNLPWGEQPSGEERRGVPDMWRKSILEGRKIAGEPEDFNF